MLLKEESSLHYRNENTKGALVLGRFLMLAQVAFRSM